ncbi:ATPase AAA [Weizmannia acidilactici]|uniref:ATPase AAA n=1 Tax=Weizmannia acidilactici TaxID=2607726 RepID=A0A5J4JHF5_9BACI|nr:sigma 54-interacting transcriptional regulator [Weizmannia acidilactici]GER67728.1 ATPase AAA [Weizmannia acidilactici]GER71533.1 ATPase AAA [Weizmannia acidilactici]
MASFNEYEQMLNQEIFSSTPGYIEIKERDDLLQCRDLDQEYIKEIFQSGVRIEKAEKENSSLINYFPIIRNMKVIAILLLRPRTRQEQDFIRDIKYLNMVSELACKWVSEKLEKEKWQKKYTITSLELQKFFQTITQPFCLVDHGGIIQEISEHMASIFHKRKTAFIGGKVTELIAYDDWKKIRRQKQKFEMSLQLQGKQNEQFTAVIQPVYYNGYCSYIILLKSKLITKTEQNRRRLYRFEDIIGVSDVLKNTIQSAKRVSKSDVTIMLRGESGTGKEMFAQSIHNESDRKDKPFIAINCAAIPENLLESELFGYEKGAFTGAEKDKPGRLELANKGTLFLDEIGDMSLYLQAKILRVIQEKTFERIGSNKSKEIDVRIISATHRDLEELVRKGEFREDLYYRISVIPIYIPPLRERKEDLPILIEHFMSGFSRDMQRSPKKLSAEVLQKLIQYDWPGNIRELQNVVRHFVELEIGDTVTVKSLPSALRKKEETAPLTVEAQSFKNHSKPNKKQIQNLLDRYGWSTEGKKKAAAHLGISLATLYRYMKKMKI